MSKPGPREDKEAVTERLSGGHTTGVFKVPVCRTLRTPDKGVW